MKKLFSHNKHYITGVLTGALAGFLYWKFAGCGSGACMITSKPLNSTLYGALMGALLSGIFKKENNISGTNNNKP